MNPEVLASGVTLLREEEEYVHLNVDGHNYVQMFVERGESPDVEISADGLWLIYRYDGTERAVWLHGRQPPGAPVGPHPWVAA